MAAPNHMPGGIAPTLEGVVISSSSDAFGVMYESTIDINILPRAIPWTADAPDALVIASPSDAL